MQNKRNENYIVFFLFFTLSVFIVHQMHLCDFCSNFHRNLLFSRFCNNKRLSRIVIFQNYRYIRKRLSAIVSSFSLLGFTRICILIIISTKSVLCQNQIHFLNQILIFELLQNFIQIEVEYIGVLNFNLENRQSTSRW